MITTYDLLDALDRSDSEQLETAAVYAVQKMAEKLKEEAKKK